MHKRSSSLSSIHISPVHPLVLPLFLTLLFPTNIHASTPPTHLSFSALRDVTQHDTIPVRVVRCHILSACNPARSHFSGHCTEAPAEWMPVSTSHQGSGFLKNYLLTDFISTRGRIPIAIENSDWRNSFLSVSKD